MKDSDFASGGRHLECKDVVRYATIEAHCEGTPIYAFGRVYINAVSPDFSSKVVIQEGNDSIAAKVLPKKSWEISENNIGLHYNSPPRSQQGDYQPFLPRRSPCVKGQQTAACGLSHRC